MIENDGSEIGEERQKKRIEKRSRLLEGGIRDVHQTLHIQFCVNNFRTCRIFEKELLGVPLPHYS
jgi:hypothetical protein